MAEERTDQLTDIFNIIGGKLDLHTTALHQHSLQLDGIRRQLDEQEITLYQHGAIQKEQSRDLLLIKQQLTNLDGKIENLAELTKANFDAVIALLSKKSEE